MDGSLVHTFGAIGQPGSQKLNRPTGVCVEPGPDGLVCVVDSGNHFLYL